LFIAVSYLFYLLKFIGVWVKMEEWEIALDKSIENIHFENGYDSDNGSIREPSVSLVSGSAVHSDRHHTIYALIQKI